MKLRTKLVVIIMLVAITLVSVNMLSGVSKVTITSKGHAKATIDKGVVTYECDNSDNVTCTITIEEIQ